MIATVEDGRVTRLQGDPEHPVTRGFLCHRTSRFLERQYSAERLTKPQLRQGKSDKFAEIPWPNALDLVAEKLLEFRDQSGGASILQYRCGGSLGIMKHVGDYFFERFGPVTTKRGDICSGAGEAAQLMDFGECNSSDFFDLHHARTIVLWGKNVYVSNVHLIPQLKEAQARGAHIILIDPVHHRTSQLADLTIQPRAGTDAAIALGIARWLFEHNREDPQAHQYCDHYDAFRALCFSQTADQWATIADIRREQLEALAAAYANGPTTNLIGWGLQRRRYGATTIRAIDALTAISGNLGIRGGGASFYFVRRGAFDFSFSNPDSAPRTLPEPLLGTAIATATAPTIRMAYIWAANPVVMLPDSQAVADAIASREFSVVVDPFMTDTARCAKLVLPTTTMLEEEDLIGSYGHHFLANVQPVTTPPAGVLTDHEIFRELSRRVGLAEEFDVDARVWKDRLLAKLTQRGINSDKLRQSYPKNPFVSDVLFADRKFKTPGGKVNLLHELPDAMMADASRVCLKLASLSTEKAQGSQWPSPSQVGPITAVVHPDAIPGATEGELVLLKNATGQLQVKLALDPQQRRDIVLVSKGGWHSAGRCANAIIAAELTDAGDCAVYYDSPVEVIRSA
jgi:anaerobic selenocysteine-containing dehydrogenase